MLRYFVIIFPFQDIFAPRLFVSSRFQAKKNLEVINDHDIVDKMSLATMVNQENILKKSFFFEADYLFTGFM